MSSLSCYEDSYAKRLKKYIEDEQRSMALYTCLARRFGGRRGEMLRAMSADEGRHLRAMQMEYYLLTGDSLPTSPAEVSGDGWELLRKAYAGEGEAAEGYAREAEMHSDEALAALFSSQSADECRHRANVKKLLGDMLGM